MNELNRIAKEYKEIEQFADYELTQCVAYELAIRNPKYKKQVDAAIAYYDEHKQAINRYVKYDDPLEATITLDVISDTFDIDSKSYWELVQMIEDIEIIPYENNAYEPDCKHIGIFGNDLYEIIDIVRQVYAENEVVKNKNNVQIVHSRDADAIFVFSESKREGYSITTAVETFEHNPVIPIGEDDEKEVETIEDVYEYIKLSDTDKGAVKFETTIEEHFKRPSLKVEGLLSASTKIELDLNRPLDELLAYITHIKNDVDKNKNVLKAPIELFGEELQKADDISRMCTETKNGKEICFDGRKGITRTQKLADMFFIYDAVQQGVKELRIRTALSEYYETIGKTTDMSDKTFRKYRDIAIDYIENERYEELITGVKA